MIVTSSSNNTPTYWVSHDPTPPTVLPTATAVTQPQRRTASSGLLMNIGYLDNGSTPVTASEAADTLSALPRPASAGAAAVMAPEDTLLYEYPPSAATLKTSTPASRHRGVNLRKQHSVSCASHCCDQVPKV